MDGLFAPVPFAFPALLISWRLAHPITLLKSNGLVSPHQVSGPPTEPVLLPHLDKLADTDKPEVFILSALAIPRVSGRRGLSESFKQIVPKAGLDLHSVDNTGTRKFSERTFHALHHGFTSALANQNASAEVPMKLTGRKAERRHQKYTHHELQNLKEAVANFPGLKGGEMNAREWMHGPNSDGQ